MALLGWLTAVGAHASPNVFLDDERAAELAGRHALGHLPGCTGGLPPRASLPRDLPGDALASPTTDLRGDAAAEPVPGGDAPTPKPCPAVRRDANKELVPRDRENAALQHTPGVHVDAASATGVHADAPRGLWLRPLDRAVLRAHAAHVSARPYSTPARLRDVAGVLDLTCERREGRPCGDGAGLVAELDTAAGYGPWLAGALRLRPQLGTQAYAADVAVDRAYVSAEIGPMAAEVGRDVVAVGPSARTHVAWGAHAPPLDHGRLSTAAPLAIAPGLRVSAAWIVGRLGEPQTYPDNLVSIARGQLDFGLRGDVELGLTQLLQVGGEGAPAMGVWDFLQEHVRRRDATASATDSSNRRFGMDVSVRLSALGGTRLYYALMFEDIRWRVLDALRYDADHLVGAELAALGTKQRHGLVVELLKTGVRSQEHAPRTTGFTHRGRVVGSPLGPDALSAYAGGRIALGATTLRPWAEVARLSSDTYQFVHQGPIERVTEGPAERRYRAGAVVRVPVRRGLAVEIEGLAEYVTGFGFEPGAHRANVGASVAAVWVPGLLVAP